MEIFIGLAVVLTAALAFAWLLWDGRARDRARDGAIEAEENMAAYGLYEGPTTPEELPSSTNPLHRNRLDAEGSQELHQSLQEEERRWTE